MVVVPLRAHRQGARSRRRDRRRRDVSPSLPARGKSSSQPRDSSVRDRDRRRCCGELLPLWCSEESRRQPPCGLPVRLRPRCRFPSPPPMRRGAASDPPALATNVSAALLILPPMLAGTTVGTMANRVLPQWCACGPQVPLHRPSRHRSWLKGLCRQMRCLSSHGEDVECSAICAQGDHRPDVHRPPDGDISDHPQGTAAVLTSRCDARRVLAAFGYALPAGSLPREGSPQTTGAPELAHRKPAKSAQLTPRTSFCPL